MNALQFQNKLLSIQENMLIFAMKLTGNREDAFDLMQDTTLKVLCEQKKYRYDKSFKGWVFMIMRNLFINNYHKVSLRYTIFNRNIDYSDYPAYSNNTESNPESCIQIKEINRAIHQLSEEQKTPFLLFVNGYRYKEISEMLGIPSGTTKSRIFFARRELHNSLKAYKIHHLKRNNRKTS